MLSRLGKRTVDGIKAKADQEVWLWDTEIKGFGLRVRPSGRKTYVVEYRPGDGGRTTRKRRYTIGAHGSPWTADLARAEAQRILGLVNTKRDPAAERVAARHREADTVSELAAVFIDKYAKQKQRSWRETQRVFLHDVNPAIGLKAVEDVTRQDMVRLLDAIAERGPAMANRTLAYVRKFFNWCIERGYLVDNPCAGIKPPTKTNVRERALEDQEVVEVWKASEKIGHPWEPIIKLLLLTAQRRSEVAEMRWSELDLEQASWTIPAERTKNKRTHEVPLTSTAVKLLQSVPRLTYQDQNGKILESPFVFTTTGNTPVSGLSKAKVKLDRAVLDARRKDEENADDLPHWTFHDLRRTATTGMARLGIHPHVADAVLNHKEGTIRGVAAVYNRHAYLEERRRALEGWETYVASLLERKKTNARDNIISLKPTA